jgi:hypothetical protein
MPMSEKSTTRVLATVPVISRPRMLTVTVSPRSSPSSRACSSENETTGRAGIIGVPPVAAHHSTPAGGRRVGHAAVAAQDPAALGVDLGLRGGHAVQPVMTPRSIGAVSTDSKPSTPSAVSRNASSWAFWMSTKKKAGARSGSSVSISVRRL